MRSFNEDARELLVLAAERARARGATHLECIDVFAANSGSASSLGYNDPLSKDAERRSPEQLPFSSALSHLLNGSPEQPPVTRDMLVDFCRPGSASTS
jgi:hypothetical protein